MSANKNPRCILLFSGKRKVGKDYLTEELVKNLRTFTNVIVLKISAPIKSYFAEKYNLSLEDLMGSGEYKEKYRSDMIKWSDEERVKDPGMFCRQAVKLYQADAVPVWVVSDIRRKTDIAWFQAMYDEVVKTVRVISDETTREKRGFVFTNGVDNVTSECDLDDLLDWDWVIENNEDSNPIEKLQNIEEYVREVLNTS